MVIEFKLTELAPNDIFMQDAYFKIETKKGAHYVQIKTWKKSLDLDVKSSGGHKAVVPKPKLFPLKILNRHYPLRSVEQAKKKIFKDRLPRFEKEQNERGWHTHYNNGEVDLLSDKKELHLWEDDTFDKYFITLFTSLGVGGVLPDYEINCSARGIIENKEIIMYGAGGVGQKMYLYCREFCSVVAWVDKKYEYALQMFGEKIQNPSVVKHLKADYIVVAVKKESVFAEIKAELLEMGISEEKIMQCYE